MSDFTRTFTNIPPEQEAIRARCFHPTGTFVEFKKEEIEQSIPVRFEKIVAEYPHGLAVKDGDRTYSYKELNGAANRIAWAVMERFGTENEPLAVMLEHGATAIVAILGVLKAGKILVVLDAANPKRRIAGILENSGAVGVLTNTANLPLAGALVETAHRVLNVDILGCSFSTENVGLSLSPDRIAQILYTSGSTGQPKGVVWDCRLLLHHAMSAINACHFCFGDRLSLLFNPGSTAFPQSVLRAVLAGAALFPFDVQYHGCADLGPWLVREKITVYRSFASTFRGFVDSLSGNEQFPDLRLIQVGGEPASKRDVERYREHFSADTLLMDLYGSTETGEIGSFFIDRHTEITENIIPVGSSSRDKEILLLDDEGKPVGPGEVGEIFVRSRYLAQGYWKDPELTREKFLQDANTGEKRTYRTGDLGRVLSGGGFVHLGRKDSLVKIRGYRIGMTEIELALLEHPGVNEAAIAAWDNEGREKCLVAYIVSRQETLPTVSELLSFLRSKLPHYMLPSAFVFLEGLPHANGKVDRRSLPRPERVRPNLDQPYAPPASGIEQHLAQIWEESLDLRPIGIHDNFFDLGGHSLAATRVVSRVIKTFQLELPLQSLFQSPTVAEMAAVIAEHQGKKLGREELDRILTEIESLPEQEAQRLWASASKPHSTPD